MNEWLIISDWLFQTPVKDRAPSVAQWRQKDALLNLSGLSPSLLVYGNIRDRRTSQWHQCEAVWKLCRTMNWGFFKDELASGATNTVKDEETRETYQSTTIYELHSAPDSTQLLTKQGASIPETIRHLTGLTWWLLILWHWFMCGLLTVLVWLG